MRDVRLAEDFVPLTEFKDTAAEWLRRAGETGAPLVLTENGKPAGVLLSPGAFDELVERARFIAAVNEGLEDAAHGRTHSLAETRRQFPR